MAAQVPSPGDLYGIYGAVGRQHIRHDSAHRETGTRGRHQLGIRRRQNADVLSVGILAASLRSRSAAGLVSRSAAAGRNSVPPGGSGFDPAVDWEALRGGVGCGVEAFSASALVLRFTISMP